jgi:hypothetical protein
MQDLKSRTEKHTPALRAILMAMRIRRYGAKHITQYGSSWDADAMVINFGVKNQVVAL